MTDASTKVRAIIRLHCDYPLGDPERRYTRFDQDHPVESTHVPYCRECKVPAPCRTLVLATQT